MVCGIPARNRFVLSAVTARLLVPLLAILPWLAAPAVAGDPPPAPDVRLVIDVSGSMKQNDPANLRRPAVDLLVKLLPDNSRAGVWTFAQNVDVIAAHQQVSERWRQDAGASTGKINSLGLFTHIGAALEQAAFDAATPSKDYRTSLILLTDGMVDISRDSDANDKERQRIIDEVIPTLAKAGYRVHTIALSGNADQVLMDKLARQTDGISAVAHTADDLMRIFLQALDQSAPSEQVPLNGNSFLVDSSIEEFTALIFHAPGSAKTRLISPDNSEYTSASQAADVKWYAAPDYDLITLQSPLEGEWHVQAEMGPDSRVAVVSNLSLRVSPIASNLNVGDTVDLSLQFQEQGNTITDKMFLQLLTIDAEVNLEPQGQAEAEGWREPVSGKTLPADGIFRHPLTMFNREGQYQLQVLVDGKTFQRRFTQQLIVRRPFTTSVDLIQESGRDQFLLKAAEFGLVEDASALQVMAAIKDPQGTTAIKPLQFAPTEGAWTLTFPAESAGVYTFTVTASGRDRIGNPLEMNGGAQTVTYPPGSAAAVAAPTVDVEPAIAEVTAEPEPEAEQSSDIWLYAGLGVGNLLIIGLAFLAYRVVMGGSKDDPIQAIEDAVNTEPEAPAEAPAPAPVPAPALQAGEPELDDIGPDDTDDIKPIEADDEVAAQAIELDGDDFAEDELAEKLLAGQSASERAADERASADNDDLLASNTELFDELDADGFAAEGFDSAATDKPDASELSQQDADKLAAEAEDLLAEFDNFGSSDEDDDDEDDNKSRDA